MNLTQVLKPEFILWDLSGSDIDGVLSEIAEHLVSAGAARDHGDILRNLKAREEILSTGIGNGVAIPHCKTDQVKDVIVSLGRSPMGVDFNSADGQPVFLFFTVLSPPEQPNPHLQVLAKISRLLRTPGTIKHLMNAGSSEQLYAYLQQEEKKAT